MGDQVAPRWTFERLLAQGRLSAYQAFSFLVEARYSRHEVVVKNLMDRVLEFKPDLLLCQHLGHFRIPRATLRHIRESLPQMVIGYHEGDVYGYISKPLPQAVLEFASEADVVFLVGLGRYAERFRAAGARRVVYSPSSVD